MTDALHISYAFPVLQQEDTLGEIRSRTDGILLARKGKQGLYFWNRRSQLTYLLSWESIFAAYREQVGACDILPAKQEAS